MDTLAGSVGVSNSAYPLNQNLSREGRDRHKALLRSLLPC